ncbi:unnamed protein product [Rhizoctonia solani]|uniref:Uncharacterized protein n=1 Tax=Rhizoctonia solani TaxID=456999 RepID=A0A8H3HEA0_9AGAM
MLTSAGTATGTSTAISTPHILISNAGAIAGAVMGAVVGRPYSGGLFFARKLLPRETLNSYMRVILERGMVDNTTKGLDMLCSPIAPENTLQFLCLRTRGT